MVLNDLIEMIYLSIAMFNSAGENPGNARIDVSSGSPEDTKKSISIVLRLEFESEMNLLSEEHFQGQFIRADSKR